MVKAIGCVDPTVRAKTTQFPDGNRLIFTGDSSPIRLRRKGAKDHTLRFSMTLATVKDDTGMFRMSTRRYTYDLFLDGTQVMRWQWHPASSKSPVDWPHYHPPAGSPYSSAHIPTGRLALEDLLVFAIRELDVRPARNDALEVLAVIAEKHKAHRSWA
jgi:hypothetical protein